MDFSLIIIAPVRDCRSPSRMGAARWVVLATTAHPRPAVRMAMRLTVQFLPGLVMICHRIDGRGSDAVHLYSLVTSIVVHRAGAHVDRTLAVSDSSAS